MVLNVRHHLTRFTPTPPPSNVQASSVSLCYYLDQAGASGAHDKAYLKMTITNNNVHGELGTALAQKDSINGTLVGTITEGTANDYILDAQYMNTGEGMNNTNEQLIHFNSTSAELGYGEMKEDSNGSFSYQDKSQVTYALSLPRVDCTQYQELKAQ